jgi:membrane protein
VLERRLDIRRKRSDGAETARPGDRSQATASLEGRIESLKRKFSGSAAEHLVERLLAMDVINRGMLFAGILLLCAFPFLIVLNALAGRSVVDGFSRRLGLNQVAATDVSHLFTSSTSTTTAITGVGYVFFVLAGIATATALQGLYEAAFELKPRGMKDTPRRVVWLAFLICVAGAAAWAGPHVRHAGGPVALGIAGFVALTLFWWLTIRILLGSRVGWREVFPAAVATGLFWVGMEIVFAITFSGMVSSEYTEYGAIGVVFALMSWLIAIGVVVILGAVVGVVWQERHLSPVGPSERPLGARRRSTGDQGPTSATR